MTTISLIFLVRNDANKVLLCRDTCEPLMLLQNKFNENLVSQWIKDRTNHTIKKLINISKPTTVIGDMGIEYIFLSGIVPKNQIKSYRGYEWKSTDSLLSNKKMICQLGYYKLKNAHLIT